MTKSLNAKEKYCPLHGFEPPCGKCMWACTFTKGDIGCAIPAIATGIAAHGGWMCDFPTLYKWKIMKEDA